MEDLKKDSYRSFDSIHRYYVQFDDHGVARALIRMGVQPRSASQSSQVLIERCSLDYSHDIPSLQGQWAPLSLDAGAIELRKLQEGDTNQVMLLPIDHAWCLVHIANRMGQRNLMPIAFKIDSSSNGEILLTALPPDRSRNAFLKSLSLSPQNLPDLTSEMQDSLKKLLSDLEPSSKNETVSMEQAQEGFFSKITVGSEPPSHPLEPFELFLWKEQATWKGSYRFFETQKTQSLIVSSESGQNWSPADLEAFEKWAGNPDRQNKDFLTHWNLKWIRTLLKVTPQQFHAVESLGHLYWPFQHSQLSSDRQYLVGKRILEGSAEFRAVDDEDPNLCHEMNSLSNDFRSILLIEPMAQFFENQQLMRSVEIQSIIDYYEALIAARMRMYDPNFPISRVSRARYHLTLQHYHAAQGLENQHQPAQSCSDEEQLFLEAAYLYHQNDREDSEEAIMLSQSDDIKDRTLILIENILQRPTMMSDLISQLTAILHDDTDATNLNHTMLTRDFYFKVAKLIAKSYQNPLERIDILISFWERFFASSIHDLSSIAQLHELFDFIPHDCHHQLLMRAPEKLITLILYYETDPFSKIVESLGPDFSQQAWNMLEQAFDQIISRPLSDELEILRILLRIQNISQLESLYSKHSIRMMELFQNHPENSFDIILILASRSQIISQDCQKIFQNHIVNLLKKKIESFDLSSLKMLKLALEVFSARRQELIGCIKDEFMISLKKIMHPSSELLKTAFDIFQDVSDFDFYHAFQSQIQSSIHTLSDLSIWVSLDPALLNELYQHCQSYQDLFIQERKFYQPSQLSDEFIDHVLSQTLRMYIKIISALQDSPRIDCWNRLQKIGILDQICDLLVIGGNQQRIDTFLECLQECPLSERDSLGFRAFFDPRQKPFLEKISVHHLIHMMSIFPEWNNAFHELLPDLHTELKNDIIDALQDPQDLFRFYQDAPTNARSILLDMIAKDQELQQSCNSQRQLLKFLSMLSEQERCSFLCALPSTHDFIEIFMNQPRLSLKELDSAIEAWGETEKEMIRNKIDSHIKKILMDIQFKFPIASIPKILPKNPFCRQLSPQQIAEFLLRNQEEILPQLQTVDDILAMCSLCRSNTLVLDILFQAMRERISGNQWDDFSAQANDLAFLTHCFQYFPENYQKEYVINCFQKEIQEQIQRADRNQDFEGLAKFFRYAPSDERLRTLGQKALQHTLIKYVKEQKIFFIPMIENQSWVRHISPQERLDLATALLRTSRQDLIKNVMDTKFPFNAQSQYSTAPFLLDALQFGSEETIQTLLKHGARFESALNAAHDRKMNIRKEIMLLIEQSSDQQRVNLSINHDHTLTLTSSQKAKHPGLFDDDGQRPPNCQIM